MTHTETQPRPNDGPDMWLAVIGEMHARRQAGIGRYGTPLQPGNGRDALRDAMDEALDLVVYLKQAITERDQAPGLDHLRNTVAGTGQAILGLINTTFEQGRIDPATARALHDAVTKLGGLAVEAASAAYAASLARRQSGATVVHDPETDWCACEPESTRRCGYRLLADTVISQLNPPDGEEAEVAICETAVERVAGYVRSLPCTCTDAMLADWDACPRCQALGQRGGKPTQC